MEEDDGVGDDRHSWAFDGFRQKKWNKEDADYGSHTSNVGAAAAVKNTTTSSKGTAKKTVSASTTSTSTSSGGSAKGKTASSSTHTTHNDALDDDNDEGEGSIPWQAGDVIGCLLSFSEVSTGTGASMSYTVNGVSLGEAYSGLDTATVMAIVQADSEKVLSSRHYPWF